MSSFEVEQPIINSPFEEPTAHWKIEEGKPPEKLNGRREAGYFYRDPRGPDPEPGKAARGEWHELELVSLIRERLASWRTGGYPGASRTTLDLLKHWRRDGRQRRLFFAQLEAAETIIFLTEARSDLLQGVDVPPEVVPEGVEAFRRYACKMATGSGKTTVMGMLCAWSILNKVAARGDARFSDVVLVVCPNLTIRGRLAELDPNRGEASIYRTRDLVPPHLMPNLRRGRVLVKNWHEFERKGMSAGSKVQKAGVPEVVRATVKIGPKTTSGRGGRYMTEQALAIELDRGTRIVEDRRPGKPEVVIEETRYVESDTKLMQRLLGREVGGKQNILVLNDEAHHAYRIRGKPADAEDDSESLVEELSDDFEVESTVWMDGLDRVHRSRRINFCVDLSATPYYLARAGEDTNRVFPWVVSDFGLTDAIESGLVKIPQLAHSDPSGEDEAKYFNIWRWIMSRLSAAERGGKRANPKPEAVLREAATPIQLLAFSWDDLRKAWDGTDEERPPVLILVCKNTKLASVIYEWLANGETPDRDTARRPRVGEQRGRQAAHDPRRHEGDRRDRGRRVEGRRDPVDAAHAGHGRQARVASGPAGTARVPGGLRGAREEARAAAAPARPRRALHRQRRDAHRGLGLQHGHPHRRPAPVHVAAPLRAGRRTRPAARELRAERRGVLRRGTRSDPRRAIRSDPIQAPDREAPGPSVSSGTFRPSPRRCSTRSPSRASRATSRRSGTVSRSTGNRSRPSRPTR